MGYATYTIGLRRANFRRGRTRWAKRSSAARTVSVFVLLLSFVVSTVPGASSHEMSASHETPGEHPMTGTHDMEMHAVHDMDHMAMHDHDVDVQDSSAQNDSDARHPCDHGDDCQCSLMSHCCAQMGSAAAILFSGLAMPLQVRERFRGPYAQQLDSNGVSPPTPPPKSILV